MSALAKPVHRQFGSKTRVARQILALVPPGMRTWVEVFAGTAAVTLSKPVHPDEHLNDLNDDIVNLFQVIRDARMREDLIAGIEFTPWSEVEWRACREPSHDPVEKARRYLVRSWQGMNGQDAKGTGWLAIDRRSTTRARTWATLPERIAVAAKRLRFVVVHHKHCFDIVERFGRYENAVLFVDPPYPLETLSEPRQAYVVDMTPEEHRGLAEQLARSKAKIILTMGTGTTVYDEVLAGWQTLALPVRGRGNKLKNERVFLNYTPPRSALFEAAA